VAEGEIDVVVTARVTTTVGDVLDRIGQQRGDATMNGRPVERSQRWRALRVGPGTVIELAAGGAPSTGSSATPRRRADDVVELRQIAGLAAGGVVTLAPGTYRAGEVLASAPSLHHGKASDGLGQLVIPDGDAGWLLEADGRRAELAAGRPFRLHTAAFEVAAIDSGSASGGDSPSTVDGIATPVRIARPPRQRAVPVDDVIALPESVVVVPAAAEFSWAMVLAPLPIGLVMAIMFRPIFALFALMGPIAVLGRYVESRRRRRRMLERARNEQDQIIAEVTPVVDGLSKARATRARFAHPSVDALARSARLRSARLWERRIGDDDFLTIAVGQVDQTWQPLFDRSAPEAIADAVARRAIESLVPAVIDLPADRAVGIVGPRFEALAVARATVLSMATIHGPADVAIRLSCEPSFRRDWDWLKWLPHLAPSPDQRSLVHDAMSLRAVEPQGSRYEFLIVDDSRISDGDDPIWREHAANPRHVQLVIADRVASLPAYCGAVVDLASATPSLLWPGSGTAIDKLLPRGVTDAFARRWARTLAPLIDPDRSADLALPSEVRLRDLLPDELTPEVIVGRWQAPTSALRVPLGVGSDGPVTLDLAADGPHALIAGTTGSGKSELLRSLVVAMAATVAPDYLTFVLIDFKGGEAFDACAELPHVGAVVTDLDEHLAGRALQSLNAELRRREQLLRSSASVGIDAHNVAATAADGNAVVPLARLVVVVDEFATLAAELPDFLHALVDVAQRGRSLGVHLVLATQRPSGVLDNKIRANTNIRIALRVQAAHDSTDVVGSDEAAHIDRRQPGRAWIRLGADEISPFQTASVSLPARSTENGQLQVRPFDLLSPPDLNDELETASDSHTADIVDLVRSIVAAGARFDRPRPAPPWLPPLAAVLSLDDVDAAPLPERSPDTPSGGLALGVADVPDRQQQLQWSWYPAAGPLLVVSSHPTDGRDASTAIVTRLARHETPESCHVYLLSGSSSDLDALAEQSIVGAVIEGGDIDRIERLLDLIEETTVERPAVTDPHQPNRFLGIDDYGAVADALTAAGRLDLLDRFGRVLSASAAGGPWLVWLTARNERAVPNRLLVHCPTRLIGKLADRTAYAVLGVGRRDVGPLPPLRFIDAALDCDVQLPTVAVGSELDGAVGGGSRSRPDPVAAAMLPPAVPVLPTAVTSADLVARGASVSVTSERVEVPIGLAAADLAPVYLQLVPQRHVRIVGGGGSGRTAALHHIAASLATVSSIETLTLSPHRTLDRGLERAGAGGSTDVERLTLAVERAAADHGTSRLVVLIDDADALAADVATEIEQLAAAGAGDRPAVTVVAAAPVEFFRRRSVWTAAMSWSDQGVLLQPRPGDGEPFGVSIPRATALPPVGRGVVVEGRTMRDVLFALPPPRGSHGDG